MLDNRSLSERRQEEYANEGTGSESKQRTNIEREERICQAGFKEIYCAKIA